VIEPGNYGIVRVVRGTYRGRIGYYDDDAADERAIVYLESPAKEVAEYLTLSYASLVCATQDEKIAFEMEHLATIDPVLRDRLGIHP
jgi:hypothetical protein